MTKGASSLCQNCQARIGKYGFLCVDLIEQVCRNTLNKQISVYHERYSENALKQVASFLESKRFIVTTELNELEVAMRPTVKYDSCREMFCWCKSKL